MNCMTQYVIGFTASYNTSEGLFNRLNQAELNHMPQLTNCKSMNDWERFLFQQDSMHITKINLKPRGTNRTLHRLDRQTRLFTNDERRHLSLTTICLFFPRLWNGSFCAHRPQTGSVRGYWHVRKPSSARRWSGGIPLRCWYGTPIENTSNAY